MSSSNGWVECAVILCTVVRTAGSVTKSCRDDEPSYHNQPLVKWLLKKGGETSPGKTKKERPASFHALSDRSGVESCRSGFTIQSNHHHPPAATRTVLCYIR